MIRRVPKGQRGNPSVGVVIAGGGLKPLAATYLFDLLDEVGIPIHVLAGNSGGVPIAAMRAVGLSGKEIRNYFNNYASQQKFLHIDYKHIMSFFGSIGPYNQFDCRRGFTKQVGFQDVYEHIFGDMRVEDLDIPLLIQATDFYTGESVVIEEGPLVISICASGALVPFLPVRNVEGRPLIDGAYSRETPFADLVKNEIEFIINISFYDPPTTKYRNFMHHYIGFLENCFFRINQTQRLVGVSVHHNESVMIPIHFDDALEYWQGKKTRKILSSCEEKIYEYKDILVDGYERVVKQSCEAA